MTIETATLPAAGSKVLVDRIAPDKLAQILKLAIGAEGVLALIAAGAGNVDAGTLRMTLANNDPAVTSLTSLVSSVATEDTLALAAAALEVLKTQAESGEPVPVVGEAPSWQYIPASSTDTSAGNVNDLLDSLLVIPATKSPGAVSIEDGAGTNRTLFAGGADSVTTLIPFPIDMRNIAAGTAWEVTTGADVAVIAFYRARA